MGSGIFRDRIIRHSRQQVIPDAVHGKLGIKTFLGENDNGIFFGKDKTQLAESSITTVATHFATPELVPITLLPVVFGFWPPDSGRVGLYLGTGSSFHPLFG